MAAVFQKCTDRRSGGECTHRSTQKLEAGKICRVSSKLQLFFWNDVHTEATRGGDTYVFNDGAQTAAIV